MSLRTLHTTTQGMRRPLVWLLVVAVLLYGHSASMAQLLGHEHRHVASAGHETSLLKDLTTKLSNALSGVREWRAQMRQRLLTTAHGHAHADATSHVHLSTHDHASKDRVPDRHHSHTHDAYQRHHHTVGDASVMGTVSTDSSNSDAASAASLGGITLSLSLIERWVLPEVTAAAIQWPCSSSREWVDATLQRLERPPRR